MDLEILKLQLLARLPKSCDITSECKIEWCNRMRTTAGRAYPRQNLIKLNARLLKKHPEHLEQTFAHELAHLAAYELYGYLGSGHGRFWQMTMRAMGYEATRCHNLDAEGLARPHRVAGHAKCGCKLWSIKPRRYKKISAGYHYKCNSCKQRLVLVKSES
jgi:SprT protein